MVHVVEADIVFGFFLIAAAALRLRLFHVLKHEANSELLVTVGL